MAQIAIVGKHPILAPQLTHKRVGVGEVDLALGGFAYVGNHAFGFDLVGFDQIGHRRRSAGLVIVVQTHAFALKKGNAKTIGMAVG